MCHLPQKSSKSDSRKVCCLVVLQQFCNMGPGGSNWQAQVPKRCHRSAHWELKVAKCVIKKVVGGPNVSQKRLLGESQEVLQKCLLGAQGCNMCAPRKLRCPVAFPDVLQKRSLACQGGSKTSKSMKCKNQQLICWLSLWISMELQKKCSKPV